MNHDQIEVKITGLPKFRALLDALSEDDLEDAIGDIWIAHSDRCLSSDNCDCLARATRLETAADALAALAPLEVAVLDALSEADLRTAAEFVSSYLTDESQAAIADRLEAAADALRALEVAS